MNCMMCCIRWWRCRKVELCSTGPFGDSGQAAEGGAVPTSTVEIGTGISKGCWGKGVLHRQFMVGGRYWIAAERAKTFLALFPEAQFENALAEVETTAPSHDDALLTMVTGWMSHLGPTRLRNLERL